MKLELRFEAEKIGTRIQQLREERGLSQRKLAKQAGLSASTIQKLESGETNFYVTTLATVARALKVSLVELWPDEEC